MKSEKPVHAQARGATWLLGFFSNAHEHRNRQHWNKGQRCVSSGSSDRLQRCWKAPLGSALINVWPTDAVEKPEKAAQIFRTSPSNPDSITKVFWGNIREASPRHPKTQVTQVPILGGFLPTVSRVIRRCCCWQVLCNFGSKLETVHSARRLLKKQLITVARVEFCMPTIQLQRMATSRNFSGTCKDTFSIIRSPPTTE